MFYLLENNRIIDSNTLFTKNIPLWEVKDNLLFAKSKNGKLIKPYKYNAIKNQSENVFDLIEEGDLIKDDNRVYEVREIDDGKDYDGRKSVISQPAMFRHWEWKIEAIYKPDGKGNYIKVWERKEKKKNE